MIQRIDLNDSVLLNQIITLQRVSYLIEAEMIDYYEIPPLVETREELVNCVEHFYGYFMDDVLAGFLSYTKEDHILDICRVAVHPDYFRKGIAGELLTFALSLPDITKAIVSTGKKNLPALRLYQKYGFLVMRDKNIGNGVYLTELEKILNN